MKLKATLTMTSDDILEMIRDACAQQGYTVLDVEGVDDVEASVAVVPMTPEEKHEAGLDPRPPVQVLADEIKEFIRSEYDKIAPPRAPEEGSTIETDEEVQEGAEDNSAPSSAEDDKPKNPLIAERDRKIREIRERNAREPDHYMLHRNKDGFVRTT